MGGGRLLDRYRRFLLTNLVEVYFELGENEAERFERALSRPGFKEAKRWRLLTSKESWRSAASRGDRKMQLLIDVC